MNFFGHAAAARQIDDDPAFAARARALGAEAWIAKDRADDTLPALLERR